MSVRILITVALLLSSAFCFPDVVTLKTGKQISGVVETDQRGMVRITTGDGVVSLPRSLVASISKQSAATNRSLEIEGAAHSGDFHALTAALSRLDPSSTSSAVAALVDNASPLLEHAANANLPDLDSIEAWAHTAFSSNPPPSLQLLLAQLRARSGDSEHAAELVLSLPTSGYLQSAELRRFLAETLLVCSEKLIDSPREDLTSRTLALLTLVQTDAPTTAAAVLLKIRASRNFAQEHKWSEAVELFASGVPSQGVALVRRQLFDILHTAENAHDTTGTAAAGAAILGSFATWFGNDERASLQQTTAVALAECGRYDEAFAIADNLSSTDADRGAQLQHRAELIRRRSQLDDQPVPRYKLAVWAREMGLLDEAARLLDELRSEPLVSENVQLQLQLLELERGKTELQRLTDLYKAAKYQELARSLAAFRARYSDPELLRRALELEQFAKYAQWNGGKRLTGQGEAAFQNAQRLYNQAKYAEAVEQSAKILADYPNSPAAQNAARLKEKADEAMKKSQRP